MDVSREQVLRFRARAGGLASRLPAGELRTAAWCGLQDSSPRSGLLSLHARLAGVRPESWSADGLLQTRIRTAAYLVPSQDFGVFTVGRLPRSAETLRQLENIASAIDRVLDGEPRRHRDVFGALSAEQGRLVWAAAAFGRWRIWWDTRTSWLVPCDPPVLEPDTARQELLRRFLAWFAPTTPESFARWAMVDQPDAERTWRSIESELVPVTFQGKRRYVHERDAEPLLGTSDPVEGVRLLPPGDPYLYPDRALLVATGQRYDALYKAKQEAAGAILLDGEIVGTWARQAHRVTLRPWRALDSRTTDDLTAEAHAMAGPIGRLIRVRAGTTLSTGDIY